ncbi:MAG: argininosuccinate lyase [Deltaproteobacteria bacterium]|nr:MAG: argininosuccinate lyase [Deltaproteobacteria bacterium]
MAQKNKSQKWSGRFAQGLDPLALDFTQSISFDQKLYYYDVKGSLAHAKMLQKVGILTKKDYDDIRRGLTSIVDDLQQGKFEFKEELEDVHRNIETELIKRIGAAGGKLHTARSRNDQVALDFRLYCRDRVMELHDSILELEEAFVVKAEEFPEVVMPGYTHLQRAQPVLFAHHLLAYVEMLERDRERLQDLYKRVDTLPLGSGAIAGTTFPIDREFVAKELGFGRVSHNSMDAVSDRDFAIEIASAGSILMMHLSRLSEEMILWSSSEFDFIKLPESFCTGSSMMPQKMNPDVPELIRGKTGRVYGSLVSLLTTMKSLPLAYNKDMQEDKEPIFDVFETAINCVDVLVPVVLGMRPKEDKMNIAVSDGGLLATEIADWLVTQGVDFRSSHEVTAQVVRYSLETKKDITEMSLQEFQKFSGKFNEKIFDVLTVKAAVDRRRSLGGTSGVNVKKEIKRIKKVIES